MQKEVIIKLSLKDAKMMNTELQNAMDRFDNGSRVQNALRKILDAISAGKIQKASQVIPQVKPSFYIDGRKVS